MLSNKTGNQKSETKNLHQRHPMPTIPLDSSCVLLDDVGDIDEISKYIAENEQADIIGLTTDTLYRQFVNDSDKQDSLYNESVNAHIQNLNQIKYCNIAAASNSSMKSAPMNDVFQGPSMQNSMISCQTSVGIDNINLNQKGQWMNQIPLVAPQTIAENQALLNGNYNVVDWQNSLLNIQNQPNQSIPNASNLLQNQQFKADLSNDYQSTTGINGQNYISGLMLHNDSNMQKEQKRVRIETRSSQNSDQHNDFGMTRHATDQSMSPIPSDIGIKVNLDPRKRARSEPGVSLETLKEHGIDPAELDPAVLKRIRNTDSARRSRLRRQQKISEMESRIKDLEQYEAHCLKLQEECRALLVWKKKVTDYLKSRDLYQEFDLQFQ